MSFEWPLALMCLLAVPLVLAAYLLAQRRESRYALAYPNLDVLAGVVDRSGAWRRRLPPALFLLALATLAVAVARPHVNVMVEREEATVVLAIDSSGSMLAEDVAPTRLEAAQAAVRTFLDELPAQFRVGVVAFAGEPHVAAPVTADRDLTREAVDFLVPLRGTAIGDAVARAAQLAAEATGVPRRGMLAGFFAAPAPGTGPPAAVLLLSDGFQTQGVLSPLDGAAQARELGIPVYSIALGTDQGVLDFPAAGRSIPVPPDRESLRRIAEETEGRYFDAPTAEALRAAYSELGSLLAEEPGREEATFAFLLAAAALGLAAAALSAVWFSRIP
ncbi:MAG: VWA domain-containing protein [Thermoleophilia bacterium]|nr:VWA domain-containing protein [Thermoleophilia bacterium]